MTTQEAPPSSDLPARTSRDSVLVRMGERFQMEPAALEKTLRATVMPKGDESREQFAAFMLVADQYALNPLTKEIYAFPGKGGGITPIVSIDGWYKLMNEHPQYDGIEFEDHAGEDGGLVAITAKIYRKDRGRAICATEYMAECKRNTDPWKTWPRRMLRHKAAIQAARAAFSLSGIYDPDEGERIRDAVVTAVAGGEGSRSADLARRLGAGEDEPAEPAESSADEPAPEPAAPVEGAAEAPEVADEPASEGEDEFLPPDEQEAFDKGVDAAGKGEGRQMNPYNDMAHPKLHAAWIQGWLAWDSGDVTSAAS